MIAYRVRSLDQDGKLETTVHTEPDQALAEMGRRVAGGHSAVEQRQVEVTPLTKPSSSGVANER